MQTTRRPLKSRGTRWASSVATFLALKGVRPNSISVISIFFAGVAGVAFWFCGTAGDAVSPWLFILGAGCIQLRLLCNLMDGMVAIEGGFKTKSGEIYNELPDRFADAFILIGAGYSTPNGEWVPVLGWGCAVLAVMTAYVRALGVSAGASQHFCGPMAKPHRMATLTIACVLTFVFISFQTGIPFIALALIVIAVGSVVTIFRRTAKIIKELESK